MKPARQILASLETRARKRFGQHFLEDANVVARIVRGARVEPTDHVIEIGPGLGVLTRALLATGARVTAVELDRDLAAFLREDLPELDLVEGDAAKVDWSTIASPGAKVVANLPYNVGTTVVMQLLRSGRFASLTVMLQKEVVDRLMAAPGTRAYGALTAEAAIWANPVFVAAVPPGAFHPPPKVHSAVLRLDVFEDGPHTGGVDPVHYDRVVRGAFAKRRKTLVNSLSDRFPRPAIVAAMERLELDPLVRGEALPVETLLALARELA
ncbi:MAG: ribosomal RNA small subunit methyltransferase A [Myxococcales bacterium]|nr:ribosomal RNA small subunit methyltransferase A [Myxococcales bacterium]MCB9672441.1 ribosomal RNA small subunit methyltransferase A [Alphaproteobacteria bacterium]MCB9693052.1 ribosomal RNA small subunit methyltransferase A [Alphaproteobacteria bacterium]